MSERHPRPPNLDAVAANDFAAIVASSTYVRLRAFAAQLAADHTVRERSGDCQPGEAMSALTKDGSSSWTELLRDRMKSYLDGICRPANPRLQTAMLFAGVFIFAGLLLAVLSGWTTAFDTGVLERLRLSGQPGMLVGPSWMMYVALNVTALGSGLTCFLVAFGVCGYFVVTRQREAALLVFLSAIGAWVASNLVKIVVARPRPDEVFRLATVHDFSFPSGHSTLSAAVYLTLALLVASHQQSRIASRYVVALGILLPFLIGLNRLYLGVHYTTDVLAGWSLGIAWAFGVFRVLSIARRGADR